MISFDVFKNGKRNAVTLSYDDGTVWDIKLIEILDKYNVKSTFHINSGLLDSGDKNYERLGKKDVADVYKNHEVSAHGVFHRDLIYLPLANIISEIFDDRKNLENLCGYPVRGLSYANGFYNDEVINALKTCGIEYARVAKSSNSFKLPENFLAWQPTCHHRDAVETCNRFLNNHNYEGKLLYVWGHSFEFQLNNNWHMIEELCKKLSDSDELWFATNIEIYDYVMAQRKLKISADNRIIYNPSYNSVWIMVDGEPCEIQGGETVLL